jgi:hypothetical protein
MLSPFFYSIHDGAYFNRVNYSYRWMTYIFSGITCLAYSVLFDLISSNLKEDNSKFVISLSLYFQYFFTFSNTAEFF